MSATSILACDHHLVAKSSACFLRNVCRLQSSCMVSEEPDALKYCSIPLANGKIHSLRYMFIRTYLVYTCTAIVANAIESCFDCCATKRLSGISSLSCEWLLCVRVQGTSTSSSTMVGIQHGPSQAGLHKRMRQYESIIDLRSKISIHFAKRRVYAIWQADQSDIQSIPEQHVALTRRLPTRCVLLAAHA